MGTWTNSDGLHIKYGQTEGEAGIGGAYAEGGAGQNVVEVDITLADLTTTAAIQDDNIFIPAGAFISKIEVIATTAATGATAALNIGLQRRDRSTELDYDGLVAALAVTAIDAAGETNTITDGGTGAGALVGTELAYSGYITADYDTAAFTAGVVKVRIYWVVV